LIYFGVVFINEKKFCFKCSHSLSLSIKFCVSAVLPKINGKIIKQFTTKDGFSFWRGDNKPIELWSNKVINQKLNYIHQNPVEEGLVFRAEDYRYSSACDYAGGKGLLDIFLIE